MIFTDHCAEGLYLVVFWGHGIASPDCRVGRGGGGGRQGAAVDHASLWRIVLCSLQSYFWMTGGRLGRVEGGRSGLKEGALVGSLSLSSWPRPWCQNGWQALSGEFVGGRAADRAPCSRWGRGGDGAQLYPFLLRTLSPPCWSSSLPLTSNWLQTDVGLMCLYHHTNVSLSPGFSPTFIPSQTTLPNSPEKEEEACEGGGQ